MSRGVWTKAQTQWGCLGLQLPVYDAGLDSRRTRLLIDAQDLVEVLGGVKHDAWPDRIASDRRTGTAHGDRHTLLTRHAQGGCNLGVIMRAYDDLRQDPIEPRVAGIKRLGQGAVINIDNPLAKQSLRQSRGLGHGDDYPITTLVTNE